MTTKTNAGPSDLDAILRKSSRQLRTAAKACRVNKGGISCAMLDVAAAVIDNAPALTSFLGGGGVIVDGARAELAALPSAEVAKSATAPAVATGSKRPEVPEQQKLKPEEPAGG